MNEEVPSTPEAQGYSKLVGRPRKRQSDGFSSSRAAYGNISPPVDSFNVIYLSFVLGGMGFLLPYNRYEKCRSIVPPYITTFLALSWPWTTLKCDTTPPQ